jgi:hypothetical protein
MVPYGDSAVSENERNHTAIREKNMQLVGWETQRSTSRVPSLPSKERWIEVGKLAARLRPQWNRLDGLITIGFMAKVQSEVRF